MKKSVFAILVAISLSMFFLNFVTFSSTNAQATLSNDTEWRLEVSGLVDNPLNVTLTEIASMPPTTVTATIFCVDFPNQVVMTGNWTGVKLGFLLQEAGVSASAIKVALFASDGYSTDLPLETAIQPDVIVAYEKDGASLGNGLRLVVPGRWGYKWISQLTRIELVDFDFTGKWESQGYPDDGIGSGPGRSDIPNNLTIQNRTTTPQNPETVLPASPNKANASSTSAPQETENPLPNASETQNPESPPTAAIAIVSITLIAMLGIVLSIYVKKRTNQKHSF